MPTASQEVLEVKKIVDKHIVGNTSSQIFEELWNKVGSCSENQSVKLSFLMLKEIFGNPKIPIEQKIEKLNQLFGRYNKPLSSKEKRIQCLLKVCLVLLVIFHTVVIFAHMLALLALPFYAPWYVSLPLIGYILNLLVSSERCVLTILEDKIRRTLGMNEIKRFIGYYGQKLLTFLDPIKSR